MICNIQESYLLKASSKMSVRTINHEFKDLGTLQVESGKEKAHYTEGCTTASSCERYLMRANFEASNTGAAYRAEFDDDAIRRFCTILSSDPDLLDDFLAVRPNIKILTNVVSVEFSSRLGSKLYTFTLLIPIFIPEGSLAKVVELHQKNNVLVIGAMHQSIKTLEERLAQQEKNIIMLVDFCMPQCFRDYYTDDYVQLCVEMAGELSHHFDMMIHHIKTHQSKVGTRLLEMIKSGKLPKLRDRLVNKHREIYLWLIGNGLGRTDYINRILQFCHLGIEIDYDVVFEGYAFDEGTQQNRKPVKFSLVEYFNHQLSYTSYNPDTNILHASEYQMFIKSSEFLQKCGEIRSLLIKLGGK